MCVCVCVCVFNVHEWVDEMVDVCGGCVRVDLPFCWFMSRYLSHSVVCQFMKRVLSLVVYRPAISQIFIHFKFILLQYNFGDDEGDCVTGTLPRI